jgi:hypothetical protein
VTGGRPSWLTVALAAAGGFLAGVLLVAILGGPKGTVRTETRTTASVATQTRTVTTDDRPAVPDVVGRRLPEARDVLTQAGFDVDVQDDTVFGILDERNYVVTEQAPAAGLRVEPGSAVTITVDRR